MGYLGYIRQRRDRDSRHAQKLKHGCLRLSQVSRTSTTSLSPASARHVQRARSGSRFPIRLAGEQAEAGQHPVLQLTGGRPRRARRVVAMRPRGPAWARCPEGRGGGERQRHAVTMSSPVQAAAGSSVSAGASAERGSSVSRAMTRRWICDVPWKSLHDLGVTHQLLDRVLLHEAVALRLRPYRPTSMAESAAKRLACEDLQRDRDGPGRAGTAEFQVARRDRCNLRRHVGDHELDRLVHRDRHAELNALLRVVGGELEGRARQPVAKGGDAGRVRSSVIIASLKPWFSTPRRLPTGTSVSLKEIVAVLEATGSSCPRACRP